MRTHKAHIVALLVWLWLLPLAKGEEKDKSRFAGKLFVLVPEGARITAGHKLTKKGVDCGEVLTVRRHADGIVCAEFAWDKAVKLLETDRFVIRKSLLREPVVVVLPNSDANTTAATLPSGGRVVVRADQVTGLGFRTSSPGLLRRHVPDSVPRKL